MRTIMDYNEEVLAFKGKLAEHTDRALQFIKRWENVSMPKLSQLLGVSQRQVRAIVEHLRRGGVPVATNDNGYYIAKRYKDIEVIVNKLESSAKSQLLTSRKLKDAFKHETQAELL